MTRAVARIAPALAGAMLLAALTAGRLGAQTATAADGERLLGELRVLSLHPRPPLSRPAVDRHLGVPPETPDAANIALAAAQALETRTRTQAAQLAALRDELTRMQATNAALRRDLGALWSELALLRRTDWSSPPRAAGPHASSAMARRLATP